MVTGCGVLRSCKCCTSQITPMLAVLDREKNRKIGPMVSHPGRPEDLRQSLAATNDHGLDHMRPCLGGLRGNCGHCAGRCRPQVRSSMVAMLARTPCSAGGISVRRGDPAGTDRGSEWAVRLPLPGQPTPGSSTAGSDLRGRHAGRSDAVWHVTGGGFADVLLPSHGLGDTTRAHYRSGPRGHDHQHSLRSTAEGSAEMSCWTGNAS